MFNFAKLKTPSASHIFIVTTALTFPIAASADRFTAHSEVSAATLYNGAAEVTRTAVIDLPIGKHVLSFEDILLKSDPFMMAQSLQTKADGATIGPISFEGLPPLGPNGALPEFAKQAFANVETAKKALSDAINRRKMVEDEIAAANDTLAFLARLDMPENANAQTLADTAQMIRTQSAVARELITQANQKIEDMRDEIDALREAVEHSEMDLERFIDIDAERMGINIEVDVAQAGPVSIDLTYFTMGAQWEPHYTARLDTVENSLMLERSVRVSQDTGEAWVDVDLSFSTQAPFRDADVSKPWVDIRRVEDPLTIKNLSRSEMADDVRAGVLAEPMVIVEESAAASFATHREYGLSTTYVLGEKATMYASGEDNEFLLSTAVLTPEILLRAVPLNRPTGYVVAKYVNDIGEPLPAGSLRLFRDGVFMSTTNLDFIVEGQEAEMYFGPVEGLKVARVTLDRNEGDRGVLRRSNAQEEDIRIDVENLTGRAWPVEVLDHVAVTEQDDLKVEWESSVPVTEEGVDDRRGVIAWRFELAAGGKWSTVLSERLEWPDGKILR